MRWEIKYKNIHLKPAGIDLSTFHLVAQWSTNCATPCPQPHFLYPCSTSFITDILYPLQLVRRACRLRAVNIFFCIFSSLMIFSSTSCNKGNSHALQTVLVGLRSGYHKSILLAKRYTFSSISRRPLRDFTGTA